MKKFKHITLGGIQNKVFNLVFVTIVLMIAVYTAVLVYQSRHLKEIVSETNTSQKASITRISEQTMGEILDNNLTQNTKLQAYIAGDLFGDAERVVNIVADYTEKLFAAPQAYPSRTVPLPDKAKDGKISMQVLSEEGVNLSDPAIQKKLGLIGNLSELMIAVYNNAHVDSCYVALPDGVMLLVDNHSGTKFDKNGKIIPIPIRDRLWYTGAAKTGKLHYTDVTTDLFTGEISIMCSLPVYQNGKLVAVIGCDMFLNDVSNAVNDTAREGSFICIVNQHGHVLFSPQKEGTFQVTADEKAQDLRKSKNTQLADFVKASLKKNTKLQLIEADGQTYYVVGAPIENVGWAVMSFVPKSLADKPAAAMIEQIDDIQKGATESFSKGWSKSIMTIAVLLLIVLAGMITAALISSKRIVKPLEAMTNRVQSLGENDLQFHMEDTYRTRDEIEVLAESFAKLSAKTVEYISAVERVTAEKERIGVELSLATRIQADMLPSLYPAFPERPEFDIYASMDPAKEVGGDFYDFFLVDDDHLCVFIADVSGKGVPAALFMMASMIILANNAQMGKSPAQILHDTNVAICANNREEMFVTVWLGILEISTGKLTAANAGHEFPVVKLPNGDFELFKDKHGFVIGGLDGAKYKEYDIQLQPGSKLFLYTDGVPEATNSEKELFGMQRMLDALNAVPEASPRETLENMRSAVDAFVQEAEQFDDLTMVCIEYKGEQEETKKSGETE
ncbi:MAG: SpoIIE family protein phosphatase [Clostridia bacterium]|nr:SpoIIE family protein phosphatase [Clostridia bacterium]